MHRLFADWHREVTIDLAVLNLEGRWEAIEEAVNLATAADVADLSRLALQRSSGDEGVYDGFRDRFKSRESTFAMRNNDREMTVLASAALIHLLETRSDKATIAALALDCGIALGWRPLLGDLVDQAQDFLTELRGDPAYLAPDVTVRVPAKLVIAPGRPTLIERFTGATTVVELQPVLNDLITAINNTLTLTRKAIADVAADTQAAFETARAESDLLWWLLSGRPRDRQGLWSEMDAATAGLLAAYDLAHLFPHPPGHPAANALLGHALLSGEHITAEELSSAEPAPLDNSLILEALPSSPPLGSAAPEGWSDFTPVTANLGRGQGKTVPAQTTFAIAVQFHTELQLALALQELT